MKTQPNSAPVKTTKVQPARGKWTAMTDFIAPVATFHVHKENLFACFIEGEPFEQVKPALVLGFTQQEVEANAKRIVKCVNMHNEIMDALLALVRESSSPTNTEGIKRAIDLLNRDKE